MSQAQNVHNLIKYVCIYDHKTCVLIVSLNPFKHQNLKECDRITKYKWFQSFVLTIPHTYTHSNSSDTFWILEEKNKQL